ncbi:MAG TPA: hypothetical protein PKV66_00445 [Candidatus Pelethenecus sp.]|nr:hypothetical protein [Candidatus Pelethenecus sp.]
MKELIEKVFEEKLNDGTIEQIVGKHIENMVSDIMRDSMSWNGQVKQALSEKLNPLMLKAVSECDLSKSVILITELLNNSFKNSPIQLLQNTMDGIKKLYCLDDKLKNIKLGQIVKLSEIYNYYCDLIEKETFDKSDLEDKDIEVYIDDSVYAYIDIYMAVDDTTKEREWGYSRKTYSVELTSSLDGENHGIVFEIAEGYGDELHINIDTNDYILAEFPSLNPFVFYLLMLKNYYCNIVIDTDGKEDQVVVQVEE